MRKKTWSLVLCAAMAASMMAGCGAKQETAATTAATTAAPAADTAAAATTAPAAEAAKPESKGNDKLVKTDVQPTGLCKGFITGNKEQPVIAQDK